MRQCDNPVVWGPHYWFFLHTIAYSYPTHPNATTKRKYYDLIQNMPLFIPNEDIGNKFSRLLDKYPVSPYLDKRASFMRWVNFIHNKVNYALSKEEISFADSVREYEQLYVNVHHKTFLQEYLYLSMGVISLLIFLVYLYYI